MDFKFYIKRLMALFIDFYFVGIFVTLPGFFIWPKILNDKENVMLFIIVYQFFNILIYILYWYILEKYYHTTLGKKLMKLKVVDEGEGNYLIRSICKFLPLDIISFLLTKDGRFWHDIFSRTTVIDIS